MWRRSNLWKQAKVAVKRAGVFSYRDRRVRRREFRKLWQVRLNAAVRPHGLSYSRFISMLKKANVGLDRKILSTIALKNPEIFAKILWKIRS
jgi:large subunit ribosomal protein L20